MCDAWAGIGNAISRLLSTLDFAYLGRPSSSRAMSWQKLLERTARTASISLESINPDSYYTASLDVFLRTAVNAAIADGVKLDDLAGILIGCAFHAMAEVSPSHMASKAHIDKVLKIAQAQHARIAELHDPAYIDELKKAAAAFPASHHH